MKAKVALILISLCVASYAKSGWKITIDKKANPVTGIRNAYMEKDADGLSVATLLMGCTDGKPVLRIAENFTIPNGLNDALFKSLLQRSLQQGLEYHKYGFSFTVKEGKLFTRIKMKIGEDPNYIDAEVPMGYNNGVYFAILDDVKPDLISRIFGASTVIAELPYKGKPGFATWSIGDANQAEEGLRRAGCILPR